ncbi:DUF6503 family protein [Zobellia galactanivorans]|uniref:DUF6503 family protein n=1 Tax=Zobellia galactanivorans (strain DSM 12802 / CCUG 47099 / CIP 106680 / NCIMB 13871 / Dsij) TaxID=63186 RepID=UPI001C06BC71|nr:DUF6503 family protein [Zobellia galactanivorans]MBU3027908.1 hypothetical protein [Zobellia galactanivorans]
MKHYYPFILTLLLCSFTACKENKPKPLSKASDPVTTTPKTEEVSLLDRCINAHGGIQQWKSFIGLAYNIEEKGKTVYQLTHLKDRRAYLKSKDFEVGFDGKTAWAKPDASHIPGNSPAFYYNLDFYFFGMPFLLKDPGVITSDEGTSVVGGKTYETLKVTFGPEVGLTPEDVYYLYIDPETFRLEILTYSVSYFNKEDAQINTAKVYSGYHEVQGLLMPSRLENYAWKDGNLGENKQHTRLFSDIRFLDQIPDDSVFKVPQGAVTEKIVQD